MTCQRIAWFGALCLFIGGAVGSGHTHQAGPHAHEPEKATEDPRSPFRLSMEELHQQGGVPRGWKFSFPEGNPMAGRDVFAKLECYQCHAIQGESWPQSSSSDTGIGPDLTGMASHHPAEYFAESILNPNAVVITDPGFTDADGLSIMPDYRESLTVAELIDLVAYLKSLSGGHAHSRAKPQQAGHADHATLFDQIVGDYRVRVIYHMATDQTGDPGGHSHGSQDQGTAKALQHHHLMAFIMDATTGEPVPYLPVTLTIPSPKPSARPIELIPMVGDHGFHYGADIPLPPQPTTVMLSIGATNMRVMPSAAGRFNNPQNLSFTWTPAQPATPIRERPFPHDHDDHGAHGASKGTR